MNRKLIIAIQKREAISSITISALRNQGKAGLIETVRHYLADLNLRRFSVKQRSTFERRLKSVTNELMREMPRKARSFGAARKALNIFLRNVSYNYHLRRYYGASHFDKWGEIPIDSVVVKAMKKRAGRGQLPRWMGVKHLTPEDNQKFQEYASIIAREMGIKRIHLDTFLWVEGR